MPDRQPTLPEFQVLSWRDTLAESCLAVNLICIRKDLVRPQAELESLIVAAVENPYYFNRLYGILSGLKP